MDTILGCKYTNLNHVAWLKHFHPEHLSSLGTCVHCIHDHSHPIVLIVVSACDDSSCMHVEACDNLGNTPEPSEGAGEHLLPTIKYNADSRKFS